MKKTRFSTSKSIVTNYKNFIDVKYFSIARLLLGSRGIYCGWGRKKSGLEAVRLAKKHNTSFSLLEDGFIRSIGLGVEGSPSFSIVEDDVGIYYDATAPSKLENILNTYDFEADVELMEDARRAIALIKEHHISKYNNAPLLSEEMVRKYHLDTDNEKVLIIAQTAGDASLECGMLENYTTEQMVEAALRENPAAQVYIKIHPDVLSGKKKSDIDLKRFQDGCTVITENVNSISLLKQFDKVYTKTSQMGFEALLVGCECVCFGMPFYAGWGITTDKSYCPRRKAKRSLEEVFAAAYILYTRYYNPYKQRDSDIFDTIETIVALREAK